MKKRVLFIAEAVTLAHVSRAHVLARTLDSDRYDVRLAWDPRYNGLLGELGFPYVPIRSLPTAVFLARLSKGRPMHDIATLRGYVDEDLSTIRSIQPDLVVSDFRLSLPVSAALAGVRLMTVANAYWSPFGRQTFLFPEYDYPLSGVIGDIAARGLFRIFKDVGFATHTRPLNVLLREHGLPQVGSDIRRLYTRGDVTAYADLPDLVKTHDLPSTHRFVGPVLWSPDVPLPEWWGSIPPDRPVIYVTLGSSGEGHLLPSVLSALADLPITVMAATADRAAIPHAPANALVAPFLPGEQAAARAALVICNGGSPTTYQALTAGVPVLAVPSTNMDQHLNMDGVRRAGAGEVVRARGVTKGDLRTAVSRMLATESYRRNAQSLARSHDSCRVEQRFPELVETVLAGEKQAGCLATPSLPSQDTKRT